MLNCRAVGSRLAKVISCHAISASGNLLAISANGSEVIVLERFNNIWEVVCRLEGHDQVVSGLHFHEDEKNVRLVSSSHDRNSYVWTRQQPTQITQDQTITSGSALWSPEIVITKLSRAGLCVQWSGRGKKFAIGSSEHSVCLCYYDADRELWAPKLIKKQHTSSITGLAWHPEGSLIATTSTDKKCRVLNAYIQEVDSKAWILAVAWSPGGEVLAFCSQNSTLTLLTGLTLKDPASLELAGGQGRQDLQLSALPLKCLAFLSEKLLVGAGFDGQPYIFRQQQDGFWMHVELIQGSYSKGIGSNSLAARIKLFEGQATQCQPVPAKAGSANPMESAADQGDAMPCLHSNCITSITVSGRSKFFTSGLDGLLIEWELEGL